MNNAAGFIKLHRQIIDWEWYQNPNTFRVFLHCLLIANFTDGRFEGHEIKRGQFVTSLPSLSDQTSLSIRQVRVALDHLIMTGELTSKSYPKFRVITVVNYDKYQNNDRQIDSQMTGERQADDSQVTGKRQQYKNDKKGRMEEGNNYSLSIDSTRFDAFWKEYPKKVSKVAAIKAWKKLKPDDALYDTIMSALGRWKLSDEWQRDGGQYITHPATWLNGRRWEDEIRERRTSTASTKTVTAQQYSQRGYDGEQEHAMRRMLEGARA